MKDIQAQLDAKQAELDALPNEPASLGKATQIRATMRELEGKLVPAGGLPTPPRDGAMRGTEGKVEGQILNFAIKAGEEADAKVLKAGAMEKGDAFATLATQGAHFHEKAVATHNGPRQIAASVQRWDPAKVVPVLSKDNVFDPSMMKAISCDYTLREVSCPIDQGGRPVSNMFPQVPAPFGQFRIRDLPDASAAVGGVTVDWNYREVDFCTKDEINARAGTKNHVSLDPNCGPETTWFLRAHSTSMDVDNCARFFDDVFINEALRVAGIALDEALERSRLERLYQSALAAGQVFSHSGPLGSHVTAYEGVSRLLNELQRRNRGPLGEAYWAIIDEELAMSLAIDDISRGFNTGSAGRDPFAEFGLDTVVTYDTRAGATDPAYRGVAGAVTPLVREEVTSTVYLVPRSAFIATGPSINYGFDSILDLDIIRENRSTMFMEEHSTLVIPCPPAVLEITHCPSGARAALADGSC